jgi:teichuronic acid biosynthesis glycosyltransferase TuaH
MSGEETRHLIWLSGQSWDSVSGSDRAMAVALSSYAPVLWVDAPASPVRREPVQGGPVLSHWRPRISVLSDRMTRLTPVALPGMTRPGVRVTTPVVVRAQIKWAMRQLSIKPAAVIMGYLGDLLGGWGEGVVNVLYGTDDWVAGARLTGMSVHNLEVRERRALARADVVVVVTTQLGERWSRLGASNTVIPNGCWPDAHEAPPTPAALGELSPPVIGLVGYLGDRVDMDILLSVADSGCTLFIVGDKDPGWEPRRFLELRSKSNVRYVGPVPSAQVRSYLSVIDIGITPYGDSAFNRASFPLKTLEYLGAGIPAVSTALPASRWLRDDLMSSAPSAVADQVLLLAETAAEFVPAIRSLISAEPAANGDQAKNCRSFAERHSWPRRAAEFAAAIGIA